MVPSGSGADAVELDTALYVPPSATADDPAPAVLLAHGFGGSKDSVADDAADLAERGYVVLTWSARGFGASTGQIGLDDPRYEVADVSTLIDLLAARDDVQLDGPGDPRVGVAGASYGGALALLARRLRRPGRRHRAADHLELADHGALPGPGRRRRRRGDPGRHPEHRDRRGVQAAVGRAVLRRRLGAHRRRRARRPDRRRRCGARPSPTSPASTRPR